MFECPLQTPSSSGAGGLETAHSLYIYIYIYTMCIYIYIYTHYICIIYIYIYTYQGRVRGAGEGEAPRRDCAALGAECGRASPAS